MNGYTNSRRKVPRAKLMLELENIRADTEVKKAQLATTLLANKKLASEDKKLSWGSWIWTVVRDFGKGVGVLATLLTVLVALFSALYVYHQGHAENFRSVLKDLADVNANTRLAAVTRLATYQRTESAIRWATRQLFGEPSPEEVSRQIIDVVAASIRLESDVNVKREMFRLLVSLASSEQLRRHSIDALARLRSDLILLLKAEHKDKSRIYWDNLRETLFETALQVSRLTKLPPDFRCFPLRGIKLRQRVLPPEARFDGATLAFAELWGGAITNASFNKANLYGAVVRDMDIRGARFTGADLSGSMLGPNLTGISGNERAVFQGSNWQKVRTFQPRELRTTLRKALGSKSSEALDSEDRDAFCSKVLNVEFAAGQ